MAEMVAEELGGEDKPAVTWGGVVSVLRAAVRGEAVLTTGFLSDLADAIEANAQTEAELNHG